MGKLSQVRVSGLLEPYAEGFGAELVRLGYVPKSVDDQLRLARHVSWWLEREGLDGSALTSAKVDDFLAERRAGGHDYVTARAIAPLLDYLRGLEVAPPDALPVAATPAEVLLDRYRAYLIAERGLTEGTTLWMVRSVRGFVAGQVRAGRLDLEQLTAAEVRAFVVAQCRPGSRGSAKLLVTALRSLLRFLHVDGLIAESLTAAVPSVAGWTLAGLPRGLDSDQVKDLLVSCDRDTSIGRRDFAILMLLVRLGLRASEAAALRLDDVDWRRGEIVICGKGNRHERLPLPADVGQAIVGYLHEGRPAGTAVGREVFIRVRAPHRALTPGGVTGVVTAAGQRAGLGPVTAHRLRHTAATDMLRGGASLAEIGQVLRHRRMLTTAIYAKVDTEALRTIARPWPGVAA